MNILIGLAFTGIVLALAAAGVSMVRGGGRRTDQPPSGRMMRALALRVAISVALFVGILLAWHFGWIHPTGIPVGS